MKEINFDEFKKAFESEVAIFSFGAPWCKDCKFVKPILEEFESIYKDINFYDINLDKDEKIRDKMGIRHIPTILFVKGGKEVCERLVEPKSKDDVETYIKKLI